MRNLPRGQTRRRIFMHDGSNDADSRSDGGVLGDLFTWLPRWSNPQTPNFWAWIGVFKPNLRNRKTCILSKLLKLHNYCIDSNQILSSDTDHHEPFVGGRPPSWKIRTIAISRPRFERFLRNLIRWHSRPTWLFPRVQIWNFKNPRWWRPLSWKIAISYPRYERFRRNFSWWRSSSTLVTVLVVKNKIS